ncbi:Ras-related protein Rab-7L1, partial [Blattella germanica]
PALDRISYYILLVQYTLYGFLLHNIGIEIQAWCLDMSQKTQLVFWPRVGESQQNSLRWEETHRFDDSEPESDSRSSARESTNSIMTEKLYKIIIIGDPTVGKTSFVRRYVQNSFKKDYKGTVGVDFALKILKITDTQTVKLQLWDIAGQERFTWMTRVYYKDCHGCVIMFDLTNRNSFINTRKWKRDLDTKCTLPDGNPVPCILLANKCDLPHRQVEQMEVEAFHKEHNFIAWTETSVKEGLMVNDCMKFLVDNMMRYDGLQETEQSENLKLTGPCTTIQQPRKCSC